MKNKLLVVLGLILLAGILVVNPVVARGPMADSPGGGMMGPGGPGGGCCGGPWHWGALDKLNLSPEQLAKIAALREQVFKQTSAIKERLFAKRNELKQLWLQAMPDEARIGAVQKEARQLRDQIQDMTTSFRLEVNRILTPEQRDRIRALGRDMGSRWAGRCPQDGQRGRGGMGRQAPPAQ